MTKDSPVIEPTLTNELSELANRGQPSEIVRVLLGRLHSRTSGLVASGAVLNEARSHLSIFNVDVAGWKDSVVAIDESDAPFGFLGNVAVAADAGTTGYGLIGNIDAVAPLQVDGSVVGWLGVRDNYVHTEDRARVDELAALGSFVLEKAALSRSTSRSMTEVATVLSSLIESRDTYTESHCVALAEMSVAMGIRMDLDGDQLTLLNLAGHLHDIGKITISDDVLLKRGPLNDEEFAVMKSHVSVGEQVLSKISYFADLAPVVGQHHERFDGSGYPRALRGEDILLEARILSVADAFDAMTSSRPYRKALPWATAVEEIERGSGGQFDPEVASIFLRYLEGEQTQWKRNTSH